MTSGRKDNITNTFACRCQRLIRIEFVRAICGSQFTSTSKLCQRVVTLQVRYKKYCIVAYTGRNGKFPGPGNTMKCA